MGDFNEVVQRVGLEVEEEYVPGLAEGYRDMLRRAGRRMARALRDTAVSLTADAEKRFLPPDEDEVSDLDALTEDERRRVRPKRQEAGEAYAAKLHGTGISFDIGGVFDDVFMEAVGKRATFATDRELRRTFRDVIDEAMRDGWSVPRTADAIRERVDAMAEYRAVALARTDLIGLSNAGGQGAAEATFANRDDVYKTWIATTTDDLTRPEHLEAHGQSVKLKETYTVGGEPLQYPGDPQGSNEMVINCRCTQVYGSEPGSTVVRQAEPERDPLAGVRASTTYTREAETDFLEHWSVKEHAERLGITPAELRQRIEAHLARELAAGEITIQVPADVADAIVRDGRFKSQFETNTSGGIMSHEFRGKVEQDMFGYAIDLPPRERPIYGYMSPMTYPSSGTVGNYGEVAFVLKQDVKARATWTGHDSLGSGQVPSPLTRPSVLSVDPIVVDAPTMLRPMSGWDVGYIEAQVHGGLTMEDVLRIEVFYEEGYYEFAEDIADELRARTGLTVSLRRFGGVGDAEDPRALRAGGEQGGSLGLDLAGVDAGVRLAPVAAGDDGLGGQLVTDGLTPAVVDASGGSLQAPDFATRQEQEVVGATDSDQFHETQLNAAGGLKDDRPTHYDPEVQMTELAVNREQARRDARMERLRARLTQSLTAAIVIRIDEVEEGEEATAAPVAWSSEVCFENWPTSDGRIMLPDSLGWREPPLSLMAMVETSYGHDGAKVAGKMDTFTRGPSTLGDDVNTILSDGTFSEEEYGAMIARMVEREELTGISVDLAIEEWCFMDPDTGELLEPEEMSDDDWMRAFFGELWFAVKDGTILAATVCPTPAFAEAKIAITAAAGGGIEHAGRSFKIPGVWRAEDGTLMTSIVASLTVDAPASVTAAAYEPTVAPLAEDFAMTEFPGPTPLTVAVENERGIRRVFGHLADWTTCHVGIAGVCTKAPRSASGYAYYHVGEVETEDGQRVAVGKLMIGTKHAELSDSRMEATRHYDDHGQVAAYVVAVDGEHGIWLSGVVKPGLTAAQLAEFMANPPSGDWRGVSGALELVAACCVPVPGFPIPRAEANIVASAGELTISALVASSGIIVPEGEVRDALVAAGCGCSFDDEDELADVLDA